MTKSMDDLLRQTLRDGAATPPTACLDAETLAAFADDALAAHERTIAEAHVATCARCQATLAALVKTMPPVPARPMPWWRTHAISWLVPAAVAATVVIVWINIPRRNIEAPAKAGPQRSEAPAPAASGTVTATGASVGPGVAPAEAPAQAGSRTFSEPARKVERRAPRADEKDRAARPEAFADSRAATPPPASPAPTVPTAALTADAARPQPSSDRETAAPLTSAPLPQAAPPPPTSEQMRQRMPANLAESVTVSAENLGRAQRAKTSRDVSVVSPNASIRWRIVGGTAVQHSTDGGSTWRTQATGAAAPLAAGASPSRFVCWLVGARGTIVLTTDGEKWQHVPFPETIDLTGILATDDETATVTTADGRTFTTSDRGKTWRG